jgi:hypothetical protein
MCKVTVPPNGVLTTPLQVCAVCSNGSDTDSGHYSSGEERERKGRGKGEERERKGRGKGEERERKGRGKGRREDLLSRKSI